MDTRCQNTQQEAANLHRCLERALYFSGDSTHIDFYISSLTEFNPFYTTEELKDWLAKLNKREYFQVSKISLAELRSWYFEPATGDMRHESGAFFSIRGLKVNTNIGPVQEWSQPIIDQPEVGVLGIITKKINGILYFLMQAKAEPGNINTHQIAPTVQSTRSNYTRRHNGKSTRYIEYFLDNTRTSVLIDQLQSEQGARFFQKRNRNVIVRLKDDEEIDLAPNYRWMTLGQLKRLMRLNNMVNMDARSVISTISYNPERKTSLEPVNEGDLGDCLKNSNLVEKPLSELHVKLVMSCCCNVTPVHEMDELLRKLSYHKFQCRLETRIIPLKEVENWVCTEEKIHHKRNLYFSVIGLRVEAAEREVKSWDQPIVEQCDQGIVGFIMREIEGVLHFLVQLKLESGNIDILGLAPTVQCITGSYRKGNLPPYVEEMLEPVKCKVVLDTMQSEEGGRFYREENRNMLSLGDDSFPLDTPSRYLWMTLNQLKQFLKFNNFLNVESRSLLAII